MQAFFGRIGAIGVHPGMARSHAKHVALTNQTAFSMAILALGVAASPAYRAIPEVIACGLAQCVLFLLVLLLNRNRLHLAARLYYAGAGLAALCFQAAYLGDRSETANFIIVVPVAAWLLYRRNEWRWPALISAISLLAYVAMTLLADQLPAKLDPALLPVVVLSNRVLLFVVLIIFGMVAFLQTNNAEDWLEIERVKSEALLHNILPAAIAERLKSDTQSIADRFDEATVLFADLVNFTALAERLPPAELVRLLDDIFRSFDRLTDLYGLEKIKTIGDAYMAAAGLPAPRADHVAAVARMALAMPAALAAIPGAAGLEVRIGMHTGPVVAGVIGERKFAYDLWGDTVNTASRMESHGAPGRVHASAAVYRRLSDEFAFEARGPVHIKGKGELETYFLLGAIPLPVLG